MTRLRYRRYDDLYAAGFIDDARFPASAGFRRPTVLPNRHSGMRGDFGCHESVRRVCLCP